MCRGSGAAELVFICFLGMQDPIKTEGVLGFGFRVLGLGAQNSEARR